MTQEPVPAGAIGDRMDRLALASARIPFTLKVGTVWVVIFAVLGAFFWLSGYDTGWMKDQFQFIAGGLKYTLYIAVGGIALAVFLAALGSLGRLSSNPIAYGLSGFYVSFFRGTPLIVQMFLIYAALPVIGNNLVDRYPSVPQGLSDALTLDAVVAGTIALGLNYGAYMTEIFRAGIQSVSSGQSEAAEALGMRHGQKLRKVILPQALRVIIPPTGNEFISMMKDTALVSFLGVTLTSAELFRRSQLVGTRDFHTLEALLVAAALYWALTAVFTSFQSRLEKRLSRGYVRGITITTREKPIVAPPHGAGPG